MAKITVTITREVMGEQVTFASEDETGTDESQREALVRVSADVRQAVNEYLDSVAQATPPPTDKHGNEFTNIKKEPMLSMVKNVQGGKEYVRAMTANNKKYGVPVYPEVLEKYLQRTVADVPTEEVDFTGWTAKVQYSGGKPKRVLALKKDE